ncbi:MAG: 50S ribosomal protein L1 [Planctomycetes bacterium]|nr:50S ribosomal protein L1 [Planctomycetota bacterium]
MVKRSKRYVQAAAKVDPAKTYEPVEALKVIKTLPAAKFDETVEIAVRLGIDPKKTDQLVRGAVSLPKGLGKTVKVVVFAEGDKAEAAKSAGADLVGSGDLADKILGGWMDFDIVIASPDMMKHVGKLGKVLGPQGKMPSPKSGTVTADVGNAVKEFKAGKVEFRTDAGGNVHAPLGKRSFAVEDLQANLVAFLEHISAMRPPAVKGEFLRRISISTTMGPGLAIAWEVTHA